MGISVFDMRRIFTIFQIIFIVPCMDAQAGFKKIFDFDEAGLAFSSLEYKSDHTISIHGNLINSGLEYGLLFASFDTSGNLLDYNVKYDSLGDVFTQVYPNSFIGLADGSGYAGIGTFFFRESGYLVLYNNDGEVQRFVEYDDPGTRADFYVEIVEVPDGFFILGDKQLNDYHTHIFLMKTDKRGNKLWEKLYGHPTRENAFGSLVKVHDNEYVIGGATTTIPATPQLVYNTSNFYVIDSLGNLKSSWQSLPSTTDMGVGYGLYRSEQGGWIYSTVETRFEPPLNIIERKLKLIERDSDYNVINERSYGNFRPYNIVQNLKKLSNSDYLLLGSRSILFSPPSPYPSLNMGSMLRLSPNGDSIWNFLDTAYGLAQNRLYDAIDLPSGSIVACGYSRTTNPPKDWAWLVKVSKDGCVDTLNCFPLSGVEMIGAEKQAKIYPNPASDFLYLDALEEEQPAYQIFDVTGRLINSGLILNKKIDISALPSGGYVLQMRWKNRVVTKKMIKT